MAIDRNRNCADMDSDVPCTLNDDSDSQGGKSYSFAYTNAIRVETSLLKLLFDINAPNYAFKDIMNWAKDAYHTGYMFNCKSTSYESQIKHLETYSNLGFLKLQVKHIILPPDNLQLNVICFNFTSMLSSLLNDIFFNKMSNLVVN